MSDYDVYLLNIVEPNSPNSNQQNTDVICINDIFNYRILYPFVKANHSDKIKEIQKEFFDLSQHLKALFITFITSQKVNNPFNQEEMNYLFGYENDDYYKVPNMPDFRLDMFSLFYHHGSTFSNHNTHYYGFYSNILNDPHIYDTAKQDLQVYPDSYWKLLDKIKENQSLISLLNQFIHAIPDLQVAWYNQQLYGKENDTSTTFFNVIIDEKEDEVVKIDWFDVHNIDFENPNKTLFSIVELCDKDGEPIVKMNKQISNSYLGIDVEIVEQASLTTNQDLQYYHIVDNDTLAQFKQTLSKEHRAQFQNWTLQPNQIIAFH